MQKYITPAQYRATGRRKISIEDQKRLDAWFDPIEDEDKAQMRVIAYLEMLKNETGKIVKFTAIPNNTFAGTYIAGQKFKSINAAKKQVEMGLRKGLCDLLIVYRAANTGQMPAQRILFLEMKREKWWTVSKEQKEWISCLNFCQGTEARVANGFDKAKEIIDSLIF